MRKTFEKIFGCTDLACLFPELIPYVHQEYVLATLFDVIAWQIRLQLLNQNSIEQIGRARYVREDNTHQVCIDGHCVDISVRCVPANRSSFAELSDKERGQISDKGVFPPPAMLIIKELVITGYAEKATEIVYDRFRGFVAVRVCQPTIQESSWLADVKQFARTRLCNQPHPWFALKKEIVDYYEIIDPRK